MSDYLVGSVAAAPAAAVVVGGAAVAAVAAVAACAAVAGAGAVIVVRSGQAVVACGRELATMGRQNLAMQEALRSSARQYDRELCEADLRRVRLHEGEVAQRLTALREQQAERTAVLASFRRSLPQKVTVAEIGPETLQRLRAEVLAAAPPALGKSFISPILWGGRITHAQDLAQRLEAALEAYRPGEARGGLFRTDVLKQYLAESRKSLESLQEQQTSVTAGNALPDISLFEGALAKLTYVDLRLAEMQAQCQPRAQQRHQALQDLARARKELDRKLQAEGSAAQTLGLELAAQSLDAGLRAIEACEFTAASAAARGVLNHLQALEQAASRQRQRNLELLLAREREHIEPLSGLKELRPEVESWLQHQEACSQTAKADLGAAWDQMNHPQTGLLAQAKVLQEKALAVLVRMGVDNLATLSSEALGDMGYQVETTPAIGGGRTVRGRRGGQSITAALSDSGMVSFRFEGYKGDSCFEARKELVRRLEEKGVVGAWQDRSLRAAAADGLIRLLAEHGLTAKVEHSDNSSTIVVVGNPSHKAIFDGEGGMIASPALREWWKQAVASGSQVAPEEEQTIATHLRQREIRFAQWIADNRLAEPTS